LRAAIDRLNPAVPAAAREDAFKQVLDFGHGCAGAIPKRWRDAGRLCAPGRLA
jgi:hypothetical protein